MLSEDIVEHEAVGAGDLVTAAEDGDEKTVATLLKNGAHVNEKNYEDNTALIVAAEYGYTNIVRELLKYKADVALTNENGSSALMKACWSGCTDVVECLLEANANPNVPDWDGDYPLTVAAGAGHAGVVEHLLMFGADYNVKDEELNTPLDLCKTSRVKEIIVSFADDEHELWLSELFALRDQQCVLPIKWTDAVLRIIMEYASRRPKEKPKKVITAAACYAPGASKITRRF